VHGTILIQKCWSPVRVGHIKPARNRGELMIGYIRGKPEGGGFRRGYVCEARCFVVVCAHRDNLNSITTLRFASFKHPLGWAFRSVDLSLVRRYAESPSRSLIFEVSEQT